MPTHDRFRRAVRGAWEAGHARYCAWPPSRRTLVQPAVEALLATLAGVRDEDELLARYWQPGAPPGEVLRTHLGPGLAPLDVVTLEEECFWRRAAALEAERPARDA